MGKPGRPPRGNVRLTVHIPPALKRQLQDEADSRELSLSDLFREICTQRTIYTTRNDDR